MVFAIITIIAFGILFILMLLDEKKSPKPKYKGVLSVSDLQYLKYLMKFNHALDYCIVHGDTNGIKKLGTSYKHIMKHTDYDRMSTANEIISKYREESAKII